MSMLLFYAGKNGYAIDNRYIIHILPKVILKKMPGMPAFMAGLLNWRGQFISVVDFCQLLEQRETSFLLSSRIILIKDPNKEHFLGILGEKVENILNLKQEDFSQIEFSLVSFPYLNGIYHIDKESIQYVDVEKLFHFLQDQAIFMS
jgi:chemotaxis-related protein WspB